MSSAPFKLCKKGDRKGRGTCVSFVFSDMQFESCFLTSQPKLFVLGEDGALLVVPQVHPEGPLLGLVPGHGENLPQAEPVVL